MHTVHLIVLIFSLLLHTEFLQSGVHVQLIGLQLPQECFPLCSQMDTQKFQKINKIKINRRLDKSEGVVKSNLELQKRDVEKSVQILQAKAVLHRGLGIVDVR